MKNKCLFHNKKKIVADFEITIHAVERNIWPDVNFDYINQPLRIKIIITEIILMNMI